MLDPLRLLVPTTLSMPGLLLQQNNPLHRVVRELERPRFHVRRGADARLRVWAPPALLCCSGRNCHLALALLLSRLRQEHNAAKDRCMAVPGHALSDPYPDNAGLVQACIEGDEGAWDELIARYGRLVYSIPLRSGLSRDDADDVFQNVCAIVLRDLHTLRDHTRLSSWLITTTHRECWRLRKRSRIYTALDNTFVDRNAPPPEDILQWEREQVREAVWRLNDRCRALLTALFFDPDEPTYEEVADRLGVPIGSIGPTRARCFKKLEGMLIEMGFEPDQ